MIIDITNLMIINIDCYQNKATNGNGGCVYMSNVQNVSL